MGTYYSTIKYRYISHADTAPDPFNAPTFDPNLGFANGRKERVSKVTWEEMEAAGIPHDKRDYCADKLITLMKCRRANMPFTKHNCHHEQHSYAQCEFDDHVLRLKEYERERRLKVRAKKLKARNPEVEIAD